MRPSVRVMQHSPLQLYDWLSREHTRGRWQEGAERRGSPAPLRSRRRLQDARASPAAAFRRSWLSHRGLRRLPAPSGRWRLVHGARGGSVLLGHQGLEPGRGPHVVRGLLQGALAHPARLLRAGLAAAHQLPVFLHRGLSDPQHPLTGTHIKPWASSGPPEAGRMADSQEDPRRGEATGDEPRNLARVRGRRPRVRSSPWAVLPAPWRKSSGH